MAPSTLKEPRRSRIARVDAVAESGRHLVGTSAAGDERLGRLAQRLARSRERQARIEKPHARLDAFA